MMSAIRVSLGSRQPASAIPFCKCERMLVTEKIRAYARECQDDEKNVTKFTSRPAKTAGPGAETDRATATSCRRGLWRGRLRKCHDQCNCGEGRRLPRHALSGLREQAGDRRGAGKRLCRKGPDRP